MARDTYTRDINPTDRDPESELKRLLALGAKPVDVGQGSPTAATASRWTSPRPPAHQVLDAAELE